MRFQGSGPAKSKSDPKGLSLYPPGTANTKVFAIKVHLAPLVLMPCFKTGQRDISKVLAETFQPFTSFTAIDVYTSLIRLLERRNYIADSRGRESIGSGLKTVPAESLTLGTNFFQSFNYFFWVQKLQGVIVSNPRNLDMRPPH